MIALLGVVLFVGPSALEELSIINLAQLAVLGAKVSYAFAGVWARLMLRGQLRLVNALSMLTGSSILMLPLVFFVDGVPMLILPLDIWVALGSSRSHQLHLPIGLTLQLSHARGL